MATRGETVDRSVLLEGVLLPVGLRRAPGDVRRGRWDGPARVAALIGAELNEGFDASGVERRSSRLVDAAIEVRTDDQFFEMARWRAAAAARRADVLARRGVNLLLCSERVDHAACDALTRRGVFVAELVPEEDIRSTLDACGGGAPATAATDDALATCDVVEAEMFAEQRLPGAPAPALYVRARGTYTALVRGPGAETSAHHKRLVERGLRVFAASLDRVEDEMNGDGEDDARVSLVPGCAAFEAAMCARLRDAADDAAAGADATPDEKSSFDDEGVDREARVMALEVTRAMCRAVPALLARNTEAPGKTSRAGTGTGAGAGPFDDGRMGIPPPTRRERSIERTRNSRVRRWTSSRARPSRFTRAVRRSSVACPRRARRRRRIRERRRRFLIVRRPRTRSAREKPRASRSSRARSIPRNTPRSNRRARRSARYSRRSRRWRRRFESERRCPPRFGSGREGPSSGARGRRVGGDRRRRAGGVLVVGKSSDESDEESNTSDDDDGWDDDEED